MSSEYAFYDEILLYNSLNSIFSTGNFIFWVPFPFRNKWKPFTQNFSKNFGNLQEISGSRECQLALWLGALVYYAEKPGSRRFRAPFSPPSLCPISSKWVTGIHQGKMCGEERECPPGLPMSLHSIVPHSGKVISLRGLDPASLYIGWLPLKFNQINAASSSNLCSHDCQ